jgi:hypothetical protein
VILEGTLAFLFEEGVAQLVLEADGGAASGSFSVGGVVVGEVSSTGAVEATVPCP